MALTLIIGNKNYSSWSMRPWLALTAAGISFAEQVVPLGAPDFKARVASHSSAAKVPILIDAAATVWESIAIIEHLAERFPDRGLWPEEPAARARARSIATEMHGGFAALRSCAPMNLWRPIEKLELSPGAEADVRHITAAWRSARETFNASGPYLFGAFCAADAMYAPVAARFRTYDIAVDPVCAAYVEAIHAHPAFVAWKTAALAETDLLPEDELDWPVVKRV